MVVAQIPLWILHSTLNGGGGPGGNLIPGSNNNNNEPKTKTDGHDEDGADGTDDDPTTNSKTKTKDKRAAQSQLNLWATTNSSNSNRRSAIYCCDISLGRIATGGGDGKIRLWSLACLFHSSKCDLTSNESGGDGGESGSGDVDGGDAQNKNKKTMAKFRSGGGYSSSDSSASSSSDRTDSETAGKLTATANGDDGDDEDKEDDTKEIPPSILEVITTKPKTTEQGEEPSNGGTAPTTTNDPHEPTTNPKQPNASPTPPPPPPTTTTTTNPSGKKRKRAALLSTTPQEFPKAPPAPPLTHIPTNPKKRILCTLASHSGSVLALRFSPSGTYLASAGDDAHVLIYTRCATPSLMSYGNLLDNNMTAGGGSRVDGMNRGGGDGKGGEGEENVEHWNRIRILRGHNLDVVGLAWAPDDSHLVSCSLDSATPICVWRLNFDDDTNNNGVKNKNESSRYTNGNHHHHRQPPVTNNLILHPYKILGIDVHTSTVKGVAFDPAGKYVASSGDDPAVCIWRAFDDWGLEERIDSSAGIFHSRTSNTNNSHNSPKNKGTNDTAGVTTGTGGEDEETTSNNNTNHHQDDYRIDEEEDVQALASLSLFRRISFAPDGTHVCGTNATLRGKNIAAMISREGWGVSGSNPLNSNGGGAGGRRRRGSSGGGGGAANLVGHKQPVVSSRHCPYFFEVPSGGGVNRKKRDGVSLGGDDDDDDDDNDDDDDDEEDEDVEPNYSTLVALGDKKGFVTIWSTRKCKPIFKLQCSESRCTVTDISWGLIPSSSSQTNSINIGNNSQSLALVISLLDGYVVALCFHTPGEVGTILSNEKRDRIFRLKYGIDLGSSSTTGGGLFGSSTSHRRRLVDDKSGPKLIENVLQYTMEDDADRRNQRQQQHRGIMGASGGDSFSNSSDGSGDDDDDDGDDGGVDISMDGNLKSGGIKHFEQRESVLSSGKKRVHPVLISSGRGGGGERGAMLEKMIAASESHHTSNTFENAAVGGKANCKDTTANKGKQKGASYKLGKKDTMVRSLLHSAGKAASAAEGVSVKSTKRDNSKRSGVGGGSGSQGSTGVTMSGQQNQCEQVQMARRPSVGEFSGIHTVISPSPSQTIYSVDLTADGLREDDSRIRKGSGKVVASCTNSIQKLPGFHGSFLCATLSISCGGKITWKDQIVGAHCTALVSNSSLMIVGTNDGTIYLYGTSPSIGWSSGIAFRSHPPFIIGTSVVRLSLRHTTIEKLDNGIIQSEMLVVMEDGSFGVYKMMPSPNLYYKGSLLAPMNQMRISSGKSSHHVDRSVVPFPKLARIQMTESNHLLLILSQPSTSAGSTVGGMLQGFLYNRGMELWMRVSDNRFMFSNFYSTVPSTKLAHGLLSKLDRTVQTQTSRRGGLSETSAAGVYQNNKEEDDLNSIFTRSHCEDRIACALALQSTSDFQYWLSQYIRRLANEGDENQLRFVVDMLLDKVTQTSDMSATSTSQPEESTSSYLACWWLSSAESVLGLNRREAVLQVVIPEMSKNRTLQRLTNEIATEMNVV